MNQNIKTIGRIRRILQMKIKSKVMNDYCKINNINLVQYPFITEVENAKVALERALIM